MRHLYDTTFIMFQAYSPYLTLSTTYRDRNVIVRNRKELGFVQSAYLNGMNMIRAFPYPKWAGFDPCSIQIKKEELQRILRAGETWTLMGLLYDRDSFHFDADVFWEVGRFTFPIKNLHRIAAIILRYQRREIDLKALKSDFDKIIKASRKPDNSDNSHNSPPSEFPSSGQKP